MRNEKGQFIKGIRNNPETEFKKGSHWRVRKPFWDASWLRVEYEDKKKSASVIAQEHGVTENAILFWLSKHGIQRRTVSEVRKIKYWGASGKDNPMYGKRGILNHNWRGGLSPARQKIYSSIEWRKSSRAVRKRDTCCKLCGSLEKTEIHHIDPFSQSPLLVMDIGNMILLCQKCHRKMRGKERRWRKKLFNILKGGDLAR